MDFLTRDQVQRASDQPREEVAVPEWGGKVMVEGLTAAELDKFETDRIEVVRGKPRMKKNTRASLVILCVVDPQTGKRLFGSADVDWLTKKSGKALDRVYEVAAYLSGVKHDDDDGAASLKNGRSDALPAGSPENSAG